VPEGAVIARGDALAELVTEKAEFTLEAEEDGILSTRLANEKSTLPVGFVLGVLCDDSTPEGLVEQARDTNASLLQHRAQEPTIAITRQQIVRHLKPPSGVRATPAARRLAKELEIDLADVAAAAETSGPVQEEDVRAYSQTERGD
jgi:pyruvate/2-oxoglutarate dehydrogenase complex dihydrolipoamide acyltransferase (E2) component